MFVDLVLPCLYAFAACLGFCILFHVRGWGVLICSVGGTLGWLVYLVTLSSAGSDLIASFLAAVTIAAYSELMARIRRSPATSYLLVAMFPLVPGRGIYLTMLSCIRGDTAQFISSMLHTLGLAGCLAVGAMLVSAVVRLSRSIAGPKSF